MRSGWLLAYCVQNPEGYCEQKGGRQPCLRPPLQAAGPARKRVRGLDSPPHKFRHNPQSACRTTLVGVLLLQIRHARFSVYTVANRMSQGEQERDGLVRGFGLLQATALNM